MEYICLRALHPTTFLVVIRRDPRLGLGVVASSLMPGKHLLRAFDTLLRLAFAISRDLGFRERARRGRSAGDIAFESLHVPDDRQHVISIESNGREVSG
jgi:hypothetical protein